MKRFLSTARWLVIFAVVVLLPTRSVVCEHLVYLVPYGESEHDLNCPDVNASIGCTSTDDFLQRNFYFDNFTNRYITNPLSGDTTLILLPGTFIIDVNVTFQARSQGQYTISANNYRARIDCGNTDEFATSIVFENFSRVVFSNIEVRDCAFVLRDNSEICLSQLYIYGATVEISSGSNCSFLQCRIQSSETRNTFVTLTSSGLSTKLSDSSVSDNRFPDNSNRGAVYLNEGHLLVTNCNFSHNSITPLVIYSGDLEIDGTTEFIGNSAFRGGAIALFDSRIGISHANVSFVNNHADHVGGAIYLTDRVITNGITGRFQNEDCTISIYLSELSFINNTAVNGGAAIYGATISQTVCFSSTGIDDLADSLMLIPETQSAISSDPLRVCICPDQSTLECLAILPDQNIPHLHYTVYPGQNFTIPAAVVGFNFALTSGSVYAQFLNSDASLGSESQYVQGVSHTGCSQLQYNVLSNKSQEILVLTSNGRKISVIPNIDFFISKQNANVDSVINNPTKYYADGIFKTNRTDSVFRLAGNVESTLQSVPVFIFLSLLDCPPGFMLSEDTRYCVCDRVLQENGIACDINTQNITRNSTIWISAAEGNNSEGVAIALYCPFHYCINEQMDLNISSPDTQCSFNHSGMICGGCEDNSSLALGSDRCLPNCTDKYLSLFIPFALFGFMLVFFIKILNLTVSQGTMNGLIFYANIVAAHHSIFFPMQRSNYVSFLYVFISWINLDLGIETCFIEGLDGYGKTWLQFVFPFYVLAIAGIYVIVSYNSTRAVKTVGSNSVSVFATICLLSYGKLLRAIITIFSFSSIVRPNASDSVVWAFDGMQYLSLRRIFLCLWGVAVGLLLVLPYVVLLFLTPWVKKRKDNKAISFFRFLFRPYYEPFKGKHYYWVGVVAIFRGVLFVFIIIFQMIGDINLLLILTTSFLLFMYMSFIGRLYKKIYVSMLEIFSFLNLGVLAAGTSLIQQVGGNQATLVAISVTLSLIQFAGSVGLHTIQFVILPIWNKWKTKTIEQDLDIEHTIARPQRTCSIDLVPRSDNIGMSEVAVPYDQGSISENEAVVTQDVSHHEAVMPLDSTSVSQPELVHSKGSVMQTDFTFSDIPYEIARN